VAPVLVPDQGEVGGEVGQDPTRAGSMPIPGPVPESSDG
jgi:hypothetical protein